MNWISVKDRLPEPHTDILLFFGSDDMAVASYHPIFKQWGRQTNNVWVIDNGDDISATIELNRPTHWMPLPEPPNNAPR